MNNNHRKTLDAVFVAPVNGNIEWVRIEALGVASGCTVIEGPGSAVTVSTRAAKPAFAAPIRARMRCATGYWPHVNICKKLEPHHEHLEHHDLQGLHRHNGI